MVGLWSVSAFLTYLFSNFFDIYMPETILFMCQLIYTTTRCWRLLVIFFLNFHLYWGCSYLLNCYGNIVVLRFRSPEPVEHPNGD